MGSILCTLNLKYLIDRREPASLENLANQQPER